MTRIIGERIEYILKLKKSTKSETARLMDDLLQKKNPDRRRYTYRSLQRSIVENNMDDYLIDIFCNLYDVSESYITGMVKPMIPEECNQINFIDQTGKTIEMTKTEYIQDLQKKGGINGTFIDDKGYPINPYILDKYIKKLTDEKTVLMNTVFEIMNGYINGIEFTPVIVNYFRETWFKQNYDKIYNKVTEYVNSIVQDCFCTETAENGQVYFKPLNKPIDL